MKNFEDMKITLPKDAATHAAKLALLVEGKEVRGDDVLRAGVFLVIEVLRRRESPSFCRNFFRDHLKKALFLGSKYSGLLQVWPGARELMPHEIKENNAALGLLKTLRDYAPELKSRIDTSGDM